MSGTYVGCKFDDKSEALISAIARRARGLLHKGKIVQPDDIHMTVLYSSYPEEPKEDEFKTSDGFEGWECKITGFDCFGPEQDILVLLIECPDACELNDQCRKAGATYTFEQFKPHIALVYNVAANDCASVKSELNRLLKGKTLFVNKVYVNKLVENWAQEYEESETEETAASKFMGGDKDPCWKGYEMVGLKRKGKRLVPNCVKQKEESSLKAIRDKIIARLDFGE